MIIYSPTGKPVEADPQYHQWLKKEDERARLMSPEGRNPS